jgi:N-acetylglucosaminyl-diphospho-decaprenol L-rhamnosyltransferase
MTAAPMAKCADAINGPWVGAAGEGGCIGGVHAAPRVDVVIVNWNAGPLLEECLSALERSTIAPNLQAIIVDNGSSDGSAKEVAIAHGRVALLANDRNRGFAVACNQGAASGSAPYLLFLNPDVRVHPEAIARAVAYLEERANAGVGIVGAQLLDADHRVARTCARGPTASALVLHTLFLDRLLPSLVPPHFMVEWDHRDTREVDQVPGAFLLIRRSLFERLGGFDERFFLYYEDVDLCLAARRAGYAVVHYAGASAEHLGGGTTARLIDRRLFHLLCSRVEYAAKRHGRSTALALVSLILLVELPARFLHATLTASPKAGWLVARGGAMFCRDLAGLIRRIWARASHSPHSRGRGN